MEALDAVLQVAEWAPVFPVLANAKTPLTQNGCYAATQDQATIRRWFATFPNCNWAAHTTDLLVIDIDPGCQWWTAERAYEFAGHPQVATPRGGRHVYCRRPEGATWGQKIGKLAPHLDIKTGKGCYVLIPPSVINGKLYTWEVPIDD
jgi:hypothetical protein